MPDQSYKDWNGRRAGRPAGEQRCAAQVFQNNQATVLDPGAKMMAQDGIEPSNRSHYPVVVVPILVEERQSIGLLQIWLDPIADPRSRAVHQFRHPDGGLYLELRPQQQQSGAHRSRNRFTSSSRPLAGRFTVRSTRPKLPSTSPTKVVGSSAAIASASASSTADGRPSKR